MNSKIEKKVTDTSKIIQERESNRIQYANTMMTIIFFNAIQFICDFQSVGDYKTLILHFFKMTLK